MNPTRRSASNACVDCFLPVNATLTVFQFFETTNSSSPNKKRKVSPSRQDELNGDLPIEDDTLPTLLPQFQSDGPQNTKPTSSRSVKPDSEAPRETHTCPVCEKEVTTENQTLNEHLDLCLNRNAIRQVQGEVKPVKPARAAPKQGDIWEQWTKKASGSKKRT